MKKNRHRLTILKVLLGLVLILSSCENTFSQDHGRTQIRWFAGLEIGASPEQIKALEQVVAEFNASQNKIELILQVATTGGAYDVLATQFSVKQGPDLVGPISWGTANNFPGQWLVLDSYIESSGFDLTPYRPELLSFYQNEEGLIALPFAVSPSAIYYVPAKFDEMGLEYPPQVYGEKYILDGEAVDWTWETFSEVAKRLTLDRNGFNSMQPEFDQTQIAQVGFSMEGQNAASVATFFGPANIYSGTRGNYISSIPQGWESAWRWWHDAMWGTQPFMATGDLADTYEFGAGNVFYAGKSAMALSQAWFICCIHMGQEFQLAVLPMSVDGLVHGRIAEESFYIWKESAHPQEAFQVLTYLLGSSGEELLPAYSGMSANLNKTDAFLVQQSAQYPFVTQQSWNVFMQGMAYVDIPSADQYLPHRNEVITRLQSFTDMLVYNGNLDFDVEFQKLQDDLSIIYNRP
jgi:multiple sugar transport system substrate-binding protein